MSAVGQRGLGSSPKSFGSQIAEDLRALAAPRVHGVKIEDVIRDVAKLCGFDYWRTFDLWYRKTRRVEEAERSAVKAALDRKRKDAAANELNELRTRLVRLESLLVQIDPDFHRETLAANREQLRAMGGKSGA